MKKFPLIARLNKIKQQLKINQVYTIYKKYKNQTKT